MEWNGFIWMNPPYSGRNGKSLWLNKFFNQGNGIALLPDRTSAPWWPEAARKSDLFLFTYEKIKYINSKGVKLNQPGSGNTLFAAGDKAVKILLEAEDRGFGITFKK